MLRRYSRITTGSGEDGPIARRPALQIVALAVLAAAGGDLRAAALPAPDLSPLIAAIGLPRTEHGARLPGRGDTLWRTSIASASHSVQDRAGDEILLFDGETTLLSLSLRHGLTDRLEIGIELPYVLQETGGLDALVDQWHDWFGFPGGLRGLVAEDRLDYRYADGGELRLDFGRNRRDIGDLRIGAAWQLGRSERSATALQAEVKLPTGSSGSLTGSGAADLSIGIAGDHAGLFGARRIHGYYRAHLTVVGEPDRLAARAEPVIGTVTGGLRARLARPLELAVQATLRSSAYDSAVEPLGATALLLNVGGTVRLGDRLRLAVSVGEDVSVDTAPDVTLGLSLYYSPGD